MRYPQRTIWIGALYGVLISISGLSPVGLIREGDPQQIIPVWCPRAGGSRQTRSPDERSNPTMSRLTQPFLCHRISMLVVQVSGLKTVHPLFTLSFSNTWFGVAT